MADGFDKKISMMLHEVPSPSEETLDIIWAGIENRIDFDKKMVIGVDKMIKRSENKIRSKRWLIAQLATGAAAVFLITLLLTTTPVEAMLNGVINFFGFNTSQDYFSVQKGSVKIDAQIYESGLGYITYYDNQYFDVTRTEDMDRFVPKTDNKKGAGQSYFEVKRIKNATMQTASDAVTKEYKQHHADVIVTDKSDTKNYMLNPLEGTQIQAYDSDPKSAKGELKKDSFYEFCTITEIKGMGMVSISYKYKVGDEDTASRIGKLYQNIKVVNEDTQKYLAQGPNLLVFDYDHSKYKLVKIRGEQYSYLRPVNPINVDSPLSGKSVGPQEPIPFGILSVGHFYNKDIDKMAQDIINQGGEGDRERKPTDLSLKSIMIVDKNNTKSYLIEDGQGGIFELQFIVAPNEDTKKILNSLRIIPLKGNEELMKAEELQPNTAS